MNITVDAGQTWTCVFDNTTNTGSVHVKKLIGGKQTGGWTVGASVPGGGNSALLMGPNPTNGGLNASGSTDDSSDLVFGLTTVPSPAGVPVSLGDAEGRLLVRDVQLCVELVHG